MNFKKQKVYFFIYVISAVFFLMSRFTQANAWNFCNSDGMSFVNATCDIVVYPYIPPMATGPVNNGGNCNQNNVAPKESWEGGFADFVQITNLCINAGGYLNVYKHNPLTGANSCVLECKKIIKKGV